MSCLLLKCDAMYEGNRYRLECDFRGSCWRRSSVALLQETVWQPLVCNVSSEL